MGLLCLVGGIIILIIFFVMKDNPEFKGQMFWIYSGKILATLVADPFSSLTKTTYPDPTTKRWIRIFIQISEFEEKKSRI